MKITLQNYPIYMVDYLAANLSDSEKCLFEQFLESHSEIKEEFELLSGFQNRRTIDDGNGDFIDFSYLKKQPEHILDTSIFIAYLEGDLLPSDRLAFEEKLVLYPENALVLDSFKQTILCPEPLCFDQKDTLKKSFPKPFNLQPFWASVAACLLFIGLLGYLIKQQPNKGKSSNSLSLASDQTELTLSNKIVNKKLIQELPAKPLNLSNATITRADLQVQTIDNRSRENIQSVQPENTLPVLHLSALPLIDPFVNQENEIKPFLNPAEYLVQRLKEDVLVHVGLSFHLENNPETLVRRYGIISKYFAYERIEKNN